MTKCSSGRAMGGSSAPSLDGKKVRAGTGAQTNSRAERTIHLKRASDTDALQIIAFGGHRPLLQK
jgi:hypothetical protein